MAERCGTNNTALKTIITRRTPKTLTELIVELNVYTHIENHNAYYVNNATGTHMYYTARTIMITLLAGRIPSDERFITTTSLIIYTYIASANHLLILSV